MASIQKITPCLWFDKQAEEAAKFYVSVFPNSKMGRVSRYGEAGREIHGMEPGTVLTVEFELNGQPFTALNGGPQFKFNEAISFQVFCDSQEELDYFWDKLSDGADKSAQQCGWLKDKYGASWQVVPASLPKMLTDADPKKSQRVMQAIFPMKKLDIAALERAFKG